MDYVKISQIVPVRAKGGILSISGHSRTAVASGTEAPYNPYGNGPQRPPRSLRRQRKQQSYRYLGGFFWKGGAESSHNPYGMWDPPAEGLPDAQKRRYILPLGTSRIPNGLRRDSRDCSKMGTERDDEPAGRYALAGPRSGSSARGHKDLMVFPARSPGRSRKQPKQPGSAPRPLGQKKK